VRETAAARLEWHAEADPAPVPSWPRDSLGDRFFDGEYLRETRDAPCLLTATIPDAAIITRDPVRLRMAVGTLVRAVTFDGLPVDHPAVRALLDVLLPVAKAELAVGQAWLTRIEQHWLDDQQEYPNDWDGPMFLIGSSALMDAVWAAVGTDPLNKILAVLRPALHDVAPGLDSEVIADELLGALGEHYECRQPGDREFLTRVVAQSGNALENLVFSRGLPPADALPVGLTVLSVLAKLCRSDSASLLQAPPEDNDAR